MKQHRSGLCFLEGLEETSLSLTPTLSRGEREQRRTFIVDLVVMRFRCWLLASFNWALHPANCELLFFFPRGEGTASPSLWSLFVLGFRAQAQEVVAEPSMLCCRY